MTTPAPAPVQPAPKPSPVVNVNTLRAIVSVLETVAFLVGAVMAAMNNGSDFQHAIITVIVGAVLHGVNHNAGGSPI